MCMIFNNRDWGEPEGRENITEVFISILEYAQKHGKVSYIDLTKRQSRRVPRERCRVSYKKQDNTRASHQVPSVAMKPLRKSHSL